MEEFLEPIVRWLRFRAIWSLLPRTRPLVVVDLGCGPRAQFYRYALSRRLPMKRYVGVDPLFDAAQVADLKGRREVEFITSSLAGSIPLPNATADCVVALAFLEHVDQPADVLREAIRLLAPGGVALFTTPTPPAKKVLEFLSFRLGLISPREIAEHKNYFSREDLLRLGRAADSSADVRHRFFEFGLNQVLAITKTSAAPLTTPPTTAERDT